MHAINIWIRLRGFIHRPMIDKLIFWKSGLRCVVSHYIYSPQPDFFILGMSLWCVLANSSWNLSLIIIPDIGGGSVSNKTRHALARISLRWMVRECFKTNTGIMFHSDKLFEIGLDPHTLHPNVLPRPPPLSVEDHRIPDPPTIPIPIRVHKYLVKKHHPEVHQRLLESRVPFLGSEEEEEVRDAVSPKYDQLTITRPWWILEILPMKLRYQLATDEWVTEWKWVAFPNGFDRLIDFLLWCRSNMGDSRYIPQQRKTGFYVHRSVKMRMEAQYENVKKREKGKRYIPKPVWKVQPTFMDWHTSAEVTFIYFFFHADSCTQNISFVHPCSFIFFTKIRS